MRCAMHNVTILAALLAGMLSFLSPCVLPLVPPYLVYLTGTSLERLADGETKPRVRGDTILAALLFVLGFSTVFVALGASASAIGAVLRAYSGELAIVAGVVIIVMGLHFLGLTPIAWLMQEKRLEVAKPVGLWGAYADGACLRVRLDAVHRPDPGRDPGHRGIRSDRGQGRRHARGLFARSRHSVHRRGLGRRAVRRVPRPLPRPSRPGREGDGRACWCSPASPSSPARSVR